jgi:hypothetical protein
MIFPRSGIYYTNHATHNVLDIDNFFSFFFNLYFCCPIMIKNHIIVHMRWFCQNVHFYDKHNFFLWVGIDCSPHFGAILVFCHLYSKDWPPRAHLMDKGGNEKLKTVFCSKLVSLNSSSVHHPKNLFHFFVTATIIMTLYFFLGS